MGKGIKLVISIIWDIFDILKLIPLAGTFLTAPGSILAFILWRKAGIWYFLLEFLPDLLTPVFPPIFIVGRIMAFVPTMTLIGIFSKEY